MQRQLVSPTGKPLVLAPVHPNAGLEVSYQRKLEALVDDMQRSLVYWLRAQYRANPPELAQDAPDGGYGQSPARGLREAMERLGRRWQSNFDEAALELARYFATAAADRADGALKAILKKSGFAVEFRMTREVNDVLQANIGEQVGLIRSIASEHLSDVQGIVMRSVSAGRDLKTLTDELQARYGVTRRRAALIARDQNNKATATITRARQQSLGITKAVWIHSHGGRVPRPSHRANDGKEYDIAEGWPDPDLDNKKIWPGTEINCRCVSRPILPGF